MKAWRPVLRMAWREARRAPARSLLVIVLIGLPVLALSAADVAYRTFQIGPQLLYQRANGTADAEVSWVGGAVTQNPSGSAWAATSGAPSTPSTPTPRTPGPVAVAEALGPGAQVIERRTVVTGAVITKAGLGTPTIVGVDYASPVASGLADQVRGRPPRTAGEVDVTATLAAQTGVRVGSMLHVYDPPGSYCVVGLVSDPTSARAADAFLLPSAVAHSEGPVDFLARTPSPVTWADVERLNTAGYVVASRHVIAHPPAASAVAYHGDNGSYRRFSKTVVVSGALLVGLALLEVILLAGPAFAIMARRQERSAAILAAAGGRRCDLRNAVLAHGIVLGVTAGAVATALGVLAGWAAVALLGSRVVHRPGPLTVRPGELAAIFAISVAAALAAAVMPARAASRLEVVAALAGRRPRRPARLRVPILALGIAAFGVLVAVVGAGRGAGSTTPILAGVGLVEIGLIMATPTLLVLTAGLGRFLPLPARLALRDAGRNRSSAAPAVAALMCCPSPAARAVPFRPRPLPAPALRRPPPTVPPSRSPCTRPAARPAPPATPAGPGGPPWWRTHRR